MPRGGLIPQAQDDDADDDDRDDGERGGDATDEEQAAYEVFVSNISNLVTDEAALPKIIERLRTGENPIEALAQTAVMLVMRVEDSALEKSGADEIDGDILLNAGKETVELLADISAKANVHEFSEDELESAYLAATDLYRAQRHQQGRIDASKYQPEMERLKQADQSGAIDQEFPELGEYVAHIQKRGGGKAAIAPPEEEMPPP